VGFEIVQQQHVVDAARQRPTFDWLPAEFARKDDADELLDRV
jgi:hypothetical protein